LVIGQIVGYWTVGYWTNSGLLDSGIDSKWDSVHLQLIAWRLRLVYLKNSGLLDK